ncbi:MAG TPA: M24 family metallopeptidase [Phycisphaerales bacterium]|nr:M24 family metallopeptidase [Phycisphaerales bacterium]
MPILPKLAPVDVPAAEAAARCVVLTHQRFRAWVGPEFRAGGLTLAKIDGFVAQTLADLKCRSCFLHYRAGKSPLFPSHACLSVNECVVHGTAAYLTRPLQNGDLFKLDIGVWHGAKGREMIGDAAWTYSFGKPSGQVRRLMDCGKEALKRGVAQLRPGNRYLDWARSVQGYVENQEGFHLVRGLGGHGIGRKLHQAPYISNVVPDYPGEWPESVMTCEPGVLVAVEPMIAVGTGAVKQNGSQWPVYTADGSMSVHYEHDVLITEGGPRILTAGLEDLDDVIE